MYLPQASSNKASVTCLIKRQNTVEEEYPSQTGHGVQVIRDHKPPPLRTRARDTTPEPKELVIYTTSGVVHMPASNISKGRRLKKCSETRVATRKKQACVFRKKLLFSQKKNTA